MTNEKSRVNFHFVIESVRTFLKYSRIFLSLHWKKIYIWLQAISIDWNPFCPVNQNTLEFNEALKCAFSSNGRYVVYLMLQWTNDNLDKNNLRIIIIIIAYWLIVTLPNITSTSQVSKKRWKNKITNSQLFKEIINKHRFFYYYFWCYYCYSSSGSLLFYYFFFYFNWKIPLFFQSNSPLSIKFSFFNKILFFQSKKNSCRLL